MSSLFVKGMLIKSADETYSRARLKQQQTRHLFGLNEKREAPSIRWIRRGSLRVASRPLRAVLNPVSESPVVTTTKKVCFRYCISYWFRIYKN